MITIYKYPIMPSEEKIELAIPGGGPVLSAGVDPMGQLCIWAIANTDEEDVTVPIYCVGTGWPLDWILEEQDNITLVATVREHIYMWHIFTTTEAFDGKGEPHEYRF